MESDFNSFRRLLNLALSRKKFCKYFNANYLHYMGSIVVFQLKTGILLVLPFALYLCLLRYMT